jgi:dihydropteroate synthase
LCGEASIGARKNPMQKSLKIGQKTFNWGERTYLMGILNVTPDSFSGDGLLATQAASPEEQLDAILDQAQRFVAGGADILDVGGESTRPGAEPVSVDDEIQRVVQVIRRLAAETDLPISVDTYKAVVAEEAIKAGAHLINDVWGFKADAGLARVAAHYSVPAILMHNRSSWANAELRERLGGRYVGVPYENLLDDVRRELLESVQIALQAGVPPEHILLDPGIGFGKTVEQNLELLDRLGEICDLGYPVLCGPSRKSFIGYTLDLPPDQRLEGTAAAVAISVDRGTDIVRVHDVEFMRRVVRMADAITRR